MPPRKVAPPAPKSSLRRVPFSVKANGAREVVLTGDFTNWATDRIRLTPIRDGEWIAQLELPPGEYQYRLLVDGQWQDHPGASQRVPNPFGSENCVLRVS